LKWLAFLTEELESIISRWEEPRVFEQQLPELSNEQLLIIGVGTAAAVAAGILAALVLIPPPATTPPPPQSSPTPSPSPSPSPTPSPTSAQNVSFSVTASDSEDPYLRYWTLLVDGQTISHTTEDSGATVAANATLQPGSHTLEIEISQSGGPSYGTYSGTAVINGQSHPFSGVDINDPASVAFTV
jgi:hypothetical protein